MSEYSETMEIMLGIRDDLELKHEEFNGILFAVPILAQLFHHLEGEHWSPEHLATLLAMASSTTKGNPYRAYRRVQDISDEMNVPMAIPSDDTLVRRLQFKENPRLLEFENAVKHDTIQYADRASRIFRAIHDFSVHKGLLDEPTIAVMDASPEAVFSKFCESRSREGTELSRSAQYEMKSHAKNGSQSHFRGTFFGLGYHNLSVHGLYSKTSFAVRIEFERKSNMLAEVKRAVRDLLKLERIPSMFLVDRLYSQNGPIMDFLQEKLNPYDVTIMSPMKRNSHLERDMKAPHDWKPFQKDGKSYHWATTPWQWGPKSKGTLPFYIFYVIRIVDLDYRVDEENFFILKKGEENMSICTPFWCNKEITEKEVHTMIDIYSRRWGGECLYKRSKAYYGRSQAATLLPRQAMMTANYILVNVYAIWRRHKQITLGLPLHHEQLSEQSFLTRLGARCRDAAQDFYWVGEELDP